MTSINDCIQFYLKLKAPNLTIFHYCHHDPVNHLTGQVYQGELKLTLKHCPHCDSENLVRNGHYKAVIKLPAFPNAEIIIDRFDIIAMLTQSFNQYCAQAMKQYHFNSRKYRIVKYG